MHPKHEEAKYLFESKRYEEAKQVILEIIETNKHGDNSKYLCKLADICCQVGDFETAQTYYRQSLNENPQNPSVLLKLGNVLFEHLNKINEAKSIYNKCLQMVPNNICCMFKYAKIMELENNYERAEELYSKCLQIDDNKASVHYYYGKLLKKKAAQNNDDDNNNYMKIGYLLKRACDLAPNVALYHYEYALYLQCIDRINEANESYETAVNLSNYEDMMLLYNYGKFNLQCKKNKNEALKYYEKASDLQSNISDIETKTSYSYITDNYLLLKESMNNNNNNINDNNMDNMDDLIDSDSNNKINLVIYNFDEIITYWNLYKSINCDLNEWDNKVSTYLLYGIFGGGDRINQIYTHFQNILQPETPQNGMIIRGPKIALISMNDSLKVIEALKRVKLYDFFINAIIIGSDNAEYYNKERNKYHDIIKIKDAHKIYNNECVLLIDQEMDENEMQRISTQCQIYCPSKNEILRGLTFDDFNHIECIINNKQFISQKLLIYNQSLMEIDKGLYNQIKLQIINMNKHNYNDNNMIESLHVIKWIERNWNKSVQHNNKYQMFMKFANKFKQIVDFMRNEYHWSAAQILSELISIEQNDGFLYARYGKCLSYLKHIKECDYYYNKAIQVPYHNLYQSLMGYGYHLLSIHEYIDAENKFNQCLQLHQKPNCKLFVGLARSAENLNKPKVAEKWYQKAIQSETTFYEKLHVHYAMFLSFYNKSNDAIYHYKLCVRYKPFNSMNHHKLAQTLRKIGQYQQYEHHLNKTLEIDPYLAEARKDYKSYYNQKYIDNVFYNEYNDDVHDVHDFDDEKKDYQTPTKCDISSISESVESHYINEFDRFWFDGLKKITSTFNGYYDKMVECKCNDIRYILFNEEIDDIIRNKIGVKIEDVAIIMNKIEFYREEYNKFIQWLKQWELFEFFYPIFDKNAIYNMESFEYNINCKQNIETMINVYHENENICHGDGNKQYIEWINRVWIAKSNFKNTMKNQIKSSVSIY